MRFHWQNLKKEDKTNHWLHGRSWLYVGKSVIRTEWAFPSKTVGISLDLNHYGEDAFLFSVRLWFFAFYLGLENRFLYNFLEKFTKRSDAKYTDGRGIGFSFHQWVLRISLWEPAMEWRSTDPKWWYFSIDFSDLLFGKPKYVEELIEIRDINVTMPEKTYPGTGKLFYSHWVYPRWFTKTVKRCNIDVPGGIPHPGKGTTSYNCGEDALHSQTTASNSIEDGIGKFVGSVLSMRKRYPL